MILNLLASFQPNYIKIDMDLIRGIATSLARQTSHQRWATRNMP
jgi:EAL domain-containing protein (putative c-di-GMP-specific phosphodiesterase class I)